MPQLLSSQFTLSPASCNALYEYVYDGFRAVIGMFHFKSLQDADNTLAEIWYLVS